MAPYWGTLLAAPYWWLTSRMAPYWHLIGETPYFLAEIHALGSEVPEHFCHVFGFSDPSELFVLRSRITYQMIP